MNERGVSARPLARRVQLGAPEPTLVQRGGHERGTRARRRESVEVGRISHAATGAQRDVGKLAVKLADECEIGSTPRPHARQVQHEHRARARVPRAPRESGRPHLREPRAPRERLAVAKIETERHGVASHGGHYGGERIEVAECLEPHDHSSDPIAHQRARSVGRSNPGVHPYAADLSEMGHQLALPLRAAGTQAA